MATALLAQADPAGSPWLWLAGTVLVAALGSPVVIKLLDRRRREPPQPQVDVLEELIESLQQRAETAEARRDALQERLDAATEQRLTDSVLIAELQLRLRVTENEVARLRAQLETLRPQPGGETV